MLLHQMPREVSEGSVVLLPGPVLQQGSMRIIYYSLTLRQSMIPRIGKRGLVNNDIRFQA